MADANLNVTHLTVQLAADPRRVLTRPFIPGTPARIRAVVERVLALSDEQVATLLSGALVDYEPRHKELRTTLRQSCATALTWLEAPVDLADDRLLLLGAYFTSEYSLEAAALFNPSMVAHPDQGGVLEG